MKKYIIIATVILYTMVGAMENAETLGLVVNNLNSVYCSSTKKTRSKDEFIVIDKDGEKILKTYNNTRLKIRSTEKSFTMAHIAQNISWQSKL